MGFLAPAVAPVVAKNGCSLTSARAASSRHVPMRVCDSGDLTLDRLRGSHITKPDGGRTGAGESVGRDHPSRVAQRGRRTRGSVGRPPRLTAERAWRGGRSEILRKFH